MRVSLTRAFSCPHLQVHGLEDVKVVSVACGWRHSIAADEAGVVYTFGWCKYGQLGHGDTRWEALALLYPVCCGSSHPSSSQHSMRQDVHCAGPCQSWPYVQPATSSLQALFGAASQQVQVVCACKCAECLRYYLGRVCLA